MHARHESNKLQLIDLAKTCGHTVLLKYKRHSIRLLPVEKVDHRSDP